MLTTLTWTHSELDNTLRLPARECCAPNPRDIDTDSERKHRIPRSPRHSNGQLTLDDVPDNFDGASSHV